MTESVVDKARRIRQREIESLAEVPEPDIPGQGNETIVNVYKATSDPGEGDLEDDEIEVKRVNSDGEVTGPAIVLKVLE